jgi:hypothetical protein
MLVRAQWQVGRDDGDDRRDYETGDGPVILDRPNDVGRDGVEAELLVCLAQRAAYSTRNEVTTSRAGPVANTPWP